MTGAPSTGAGRERGQALPEFALVVPLFFLVIFGIIQLGFLLAGQNGLTNATREAARYASTLPTPDTSVAGTCAAAGSNAEMVYSRLKTVNLPQYIPGIQSGNIISGPGALSGCATWAQSGTGTGVAYCKRDNGDSTWSIRVRVRVIYAHPLFIPLVGQIFSSTNTLRLGAVEEMRVEGPNRSSSSANLGGFTTCP